MTHRLDAATASRTSKMRLYSRSFPWTVDIISETGSIVTLDSVWTAINQALSADIADSEWGMLMNDKKQRDIIKKAAKERDTSPRLKRIDWLGEATIFSGLEKDEEFIEKRNFPGGKEIKETWVMTFSSR
jgi:hypothetical protein